MKHHHLSKSEPLCEESPLLGNEYPAAYYTGKPQSDCEAESQSSNSSYSGREKRHAFSSLLAPIPRIGHHTFDLEDWQPLKSVYRSGARVAEALPAVVIALLLNLLDALSYGILLFPPGDPIFADSGPEGMSLFYISCIMSQLVCSTGSIFKGSVGSQLIEAVPFFHRMCSIIIQQMGRESPEAVRATVVTAYAMSAILTGVIFTLLGVARLGRLVDLIPRTVLIGCIGGIGIFLLYTGVAVSARVDGSLPFSMPALLHLFKVNIVFLWTLPLLLAVALLTVQRCYDRSWLLPVCFACITVVFYFSTTLTGSVSIPELRDSGWLFEPPGKGVPFYNVYMYYNFHLVDWPALWATLPTQMALIFFSILHVPINVPNLAVQMEEDNVNIDRELVLHGISNTLSGCFGSVQNYLCFVNSVYFIRTGGNGRLAGYLLAAATFMIWVINSDIVGFVPITVVATLIYMLGVELSMDALIKTFKRMPFAEYAVVVITALAMAFYDFVSGIAIGLGLAGLTYVVTSSRTDAVRAECHGSDARSTVLWQLLHRSQLERSREQLQVLKLGGFLSFGTIIHVENRIRNIAENESKTSQQMNELIFDCCQVSGIDFSAAEAFIRIKRGLHRRHVQLSFTGLSTSGPVYTMLRRVGVFDAYDPESSPSSPEIYGRLEDALEAYEQNEVSASQDQNNLQSIECKISPADDLLLDEAWLPRIGPLHFFPFPPRKDSLDPLTPPDSRGKSYTTKEPLKVLMRALEGLSEKDVDFWLPAMSYFSPRTFLAGKSYQGDVAVESFCLLCHGSLHITHHGDRGDCVEKIMPGTACGELPLFSETKIPCTILPKSDCLVWVMTREQWRALQLVEKDIVKEFLQVGINLTTARAAAVSRYNTIHTS